MNDNPENNVMRVEIAIPTIELWAKSKGLEANTETAQQFAGMFAADMCEVIRQVEEHIGYPVGFLRAAISACFYLSEASAPDEKRVNRIAEAIEAATKRVMDLAQYSASQIVDAPETAQ